MKKFKALASIVMILALVLSFGVAAFAATEAGTLTVTVAEDAENPAATAYKVIEFDAANGAWKLTGWAAGVLTPTTGTEEEKAAAAATALAALTNSENSDQPAIRGYLTTLALADKTNSSSYGFVADTTYTNVLTVTPDGENAVAAGYLIIATAGNYDYSPMFLNTFNSANDYALANAAATAKGVKKNVIETKEAFAGTTADTEYQINDVVTYTVTGHIPDFRGTGAPALAIKDTLSANTVLADANIVVEVDGAEVYAGETNAYTTDAERDDTEFTVTFNQAYLDTNAVAIAGKTFTITYNVRITGYNENNTYTNTISGKMNVTGSEQDIPEVTNDVYTAAVEFKKVGVGNEEVGLANAQFRLSYKESAAEDAPTYYVTVAGGVVTGTQTEATDASIVTSDANGVFAVKGLDPDRAYTITEVTAPNAYAKLGDVQIAFKQDDTNKNLFKAAVTGAGDSGYTVNDQDTAKAVVSVTISDPRLGVLPATGGVGIVVVSVIGVAVMLAFGGAFIVLKKKKNEAN